MLKVPLCDTVPQGRDDPGFFGSPGRWKVESTCFLGVLWDFLSGSDSTGAGLLLVLPRSRS